jgi:hypothetical protein
MALLNINQFAFNVAAATRKKRDAADPFHVAYTDATPAQRKQLREEWMIGHLRGQGFEQHAERILSKGKGKGAGAKPEHVKAIDRASSDFRYMVVRPEPAKKRDDNTDPVAKLLAAYAKLTPAEQRKFLRSI